MDVTLGSSRDNVGQVSGEVLTDDRQWHKHQSLPFSFLSSSKTAEAEFLSQGVDASFDEAEHHIAEADEMLEEYLEQVRGRLKCKRGIVYVSLNKDSHVLELPEVCLSPVCGVQ